MQLVNNILVPDTYLKQKKIDIYLLYLFFFFISVYADIFFIDFAFCNIALW